MKEGLEENRKICQKQQTELRRILPSAEHYQEARELFFKQHAMLHSAKMSQGELFSLEDEVFDDLCEETARRIPHSSDHSIVWNIWHIARIEDMTMNLLVAGSPQILNQDNWLTELGAKITDTGNAMDPEAVVELSKEVDISALRDYRMAVGRRTREIVKALQAADLKSKVDPARLDQVMDEGGVVEEARWLINYWGKRDIAGLLLMPATRHNLVHLNECFRLKHKR